MPHHFLLYADWSEKEAKEQAAELKKQIADKAQTTKEREAKRREEAKKFRKTQKERKASLEGERKTKEEAERRKEASRRSYVDAALQAVKRIMSDSDPLRRSLKRLTMTPEESKLISQALRDAAGRLREIAGQRGSQ